METSRSKGFLFFRYRGRLLVLVLLAASSLLVTASNVRADNSTQLDPDYGEYPRVVKLSNGALIATFTQHTSNGDVNPIYRSDNDGDSWSRIATVNTGRRSNNYSCCSTLFEVPQQIGSLSAGTILLATRTGLNGSDEGLDVWRSTNGGYNWDFHNTPATGSMWEPEFSVDSQGRLVLYFADERQGGYSQVLAHQVSTNGVDFVDYHIDVGVQDNNQRPGMPIVRKMGNGTYVMAYEWCGSWGDCQIYTRASSNGYDWGNPSDMGSRVQSGRGAYYVGSPGMTWIPGGDYGRLIITGRFLNGVGDGNGTTAMVTSDTNGAGGWQEISTPIDTSNNASDGQSWHCEGYSSALQLVGGGKWLMLAGKVVNGNTCRIFYGTNYLP